MDIKEIEIPIFLHPHLFWIFWRKDSKKRIQLQNDLAKEYSGIDQKYEEFNIGEIVVVRKNLIWKRAAIENKVEGNTYEVWLIDYGHLEHTSTVYKLNPKFDLTKLPPLIHEACLSNVVFLNEDLNIEDNSIVQQKNTLPNAGATINALQCMGDYQLFFKKIKEVNKTVFGDIMYKKDGETSSLSKALIDKNLMIEDPELFAKVELIRTNYKVLYSAALRQASKKHEDSRFSFDLSLLMDEVFMRSTSRGISLVNNSQLQSSKSNTSLKAISKSEIIKNLRKKSEERKMELLSCTDSEREDMQVEGGRTPSVNMDKQFSKASVLKRLINRRKAALESKNQSCTDEVTSGSEANVNRDNSTSVASKLAALKLRTRKTQAKEDLIDTTSGQSKGEVIEPKLLKSENAIFMPGGMRSMPNKKKKSSDASSISERSDSGKSITNKTCTSTKEFEVKEEINKSTKAENFPHSRNIMIRKLVERTKNVLSNTSDASDSDMIRNKESQKCFIEKNTSNISKNDAPCEESISGNITEDPLMNKRNNSIESNTTHNSDFENSRKSSEEQKKAETDRECKDDPTKPQNAVDSQMVVTPFCNCSQCKFWTSSEGWDIGNENFTEEEKCKKKQMRPPSLMLKEPREEDIKLASVDYKFMTKLEKNASFKILVHGRLIPPAVDRVVEAPFHPAIHRTLSKLKYVRTKKIQSYIWPAITRSMNVFYVNRKQSGKTLAYLPPLCSFLIEREERYSDLKKGGPIAIVLGKTSTECEEIYDLANKLVEGGGHNKPRILLVTYPFQFVNLSSVDMLITIPPILIELLKKNATNFKRLCHLVLENLDVLLLKYNDEMKSIIAAIESMLLQRTIRQNVQMIMNGEHWTLKVEKFLIDLRDTPLISIGDYLEAAIYGGIKLKVKLLEEKAKCDAVVDILKDKWKYYKSIIICNANEEIEKLKTVLDLASITYIPITDDLTTEQIYQNESNWESNCAGQYNVLICTDVVLHTMLSITSASLIIHFSLPSKWSLWLKRFYCLLENYTSPLTKKKDNLKCEGYILTDELCVDQIPRLLLLLKNYNVSLNQFEPVCKQMEVEKEEVKIAAELPLCSSLKQFGYCHTVSCPDRHLLDRELDCNSSLPQNGTIKFKILKLIDVNHLKVFIIEHKDIEGKITNYKSQKGLDDEKLTSLLKVKKERAESIKEKSSYAYWDEEDFNDMFRECLVEKIKNDVVDILVIDNGKRTTVSKSKIFKLPDEFNKKNDINSCSTNVIIANFKPPYKDENFSARAFFKLNGFIEDIGYNDSIFVSNICLQLGDTIWVNTISEEIKVFNLDLQKSNLSKELVKRKLAEINLEHMENLYSECKSAGIVLPKYDIPIEEKLLREPPQEKPQWAFLEMDDYNKVYFSSAVSLNEIYVRLAKFDSLLINLEKDMTEVAIRQGSKQNFAIIEGRYYLAKEPVEDRYTRVLIIRIKGDNALCFSVDYGDEAVVPLKDIRYLSNYLIKKLPFQAIQCRLFGISPIEGDDAVDILYKKFTFETDSKFYRTLYAQCVLYEKGVNKGQSFFSILLKDVVEKPILLNQLFIDCGWAALIPGATIRDFEVLFTESEEDSYTEEESNDIEKIKEIVETSKSISSNHIVPKRPLNNFEYKEDNDELEFFFGSGDEVDNFIDFMNKMNNTSKEVESESKVCNTLPAIEAAPFEVDYFTPDVYWSQTKKRIEMVIRLPNVKTYNVKVLKSNIFNFQTTVDEKKYVVNLVLYQSVEKEFTHKLGGLDVKIILNKNKEEEWPKLSRSKNRLRNVHYLLSKEELEEDEDDGKLFLDLGKDLADISESESDDAIFDVYSDRDSEYELDLPEDVEL